MRLFTFNIEKRTRKALCCATELGDAVRSKKTRHTCEQVMTQLEAAGSEQTRNTYRRHGVTGDMFGVSYATLKAMDKQVAHDSELAEQLWASGNHDARVFACWIAEEEKITTGQLRTWAKDITYPGLGGELASLAAFSRFGPGLSKTWRESKNDLHSAMGWGIVATLAMQPDRPASEGGMSDAELLACLADIEARIHSAPNRTRMHMNNALIAIGCRESTADAARAVAARVGAVDVDHGDTACKTPVAAESIEKTWAHYQAKGKLPTDGTAGKRRRHC